EALEALQREYRASAVTWISWGAAGSVGYVVRLCTGPLWKLMHAQLRLAGRKWDWRQSVRAAQGQRRLYRADVAASRQLETVALGEMRELFTTSDIWSIIPPASRSCEVRSLAFKYLSACSFVSSWFAYWEGTEDGPFWPAAFDDLWNLKLAFQEETAAIEDGHAAIRRDVNLLSTQTTSPHIHTVSAKHIARAVRRLGRLAPRGLDRGLAAVDAGAEQADDEAPEQPRKRMKRGSWTFRAFLSEQTRGTKGGCAAPGRGQQFRETSASGRERLHRKGKDAEAAWSAGGRGFGMNNRDIDMALLRRRRLEQQKRLSDELVASGVPALEPSTNEVEELGVLPFTEWGQTLAQVSKAEAWRNRKTAQLDRLVDQALVAFSEGGVGESMDFLKKAVESTCPHYGPAPSTTAAALGRETPRAIAITLKLCDNPVNVTVHMFKQFKSAVKRRLHQGVASKLLAHSDILYLLTRKVGEPQGDGRDPAFRVAEQRLYHCGWQTLSRSDFHGYFLEVALRDEKVDAAGGLPLDELTASGGPDYDGISTWEHLHQPDLREIKFWDGQADVDAALAPKPSKPRGPRNQPRPRQRGRRKRSEPSPILDMSGGEGYDKTDESHEDSDGVQFPTADSDVRGLDHHQDLGSDFDPGALGADGRPLGGDGGEVGPGTPIGGCEAPDGRALTDASHDGGAGEDDLDASALGAAPAAPP
ncbi:unnamed protein product, partial [Prorocentrum cordatum]